MLLFYAKANRYRIEELRYILRPTPTYGDTNLPNMVSLGHDVLRYVLDKIMPSRLVSIAPDLLSLQCAAVGSWLIQVCEGVWHVRTLLTSATKALASTAASRAFGDYHSLDSASNVLQATRRREGCFVPSGLFPCRALEDRPGSIRSAFKGCISDQLAVCLHPGRN